MSSYTFSKNEKLCSRTLIKKLFTSGKWMKCYPFRVGSIPLEKSDVTAKVLISVPKKRFARAVDRNRIKRQIRESYRLNCPALIEHWRLDGKYFALGFVYIANDMPVSQELSKSMIRSLEKLKSL